MFDWTHAIHLMGGILALVYALVASQLHKPVESRRIVIEIAAGIGTLWLRCGFSFALLCAVGADYATLTEEN